MRLEVGEGKEENGKELRRNKAGRRKKEEKRWDERLNR
jgi:hypothetical protein